MVSASSASVLLNSMEQAEKDLALYAAIIGCKPTVDRAPATEAPPLGAPSTNAAQADASVIDPFPRLAVSHPHEPGRISIWMRYVSHEAKKRLHEAKLRLAS